ncbi:MAG TPA: protein translocase subunit SecD [Candidatus Kapabacteria bacterium]|nr:protein translocase subunit SecD [Candidatus Kapabacteria bacterium]
MKNNIGKILLIFVPIVAVLAVMYPSYRASDLDSKLKEYQERAKKAGNTADSIKIMDEFKNTYGEDLESAKKNQLKLGLDLRGGMYVTMEVDVVKLIEESAQRESIDDVFEQVLDKTREEAKSSEKETIDLFIENFNAIARPKGKTLISYFDVGDIRDASEEKIIEKLKKDAKDAVDQAVEVLRQRIDQYGVSEPNIQKQGNNRIILELPGVEDDLQMRALISTTARLEFNLVRNNAEIVRAFGKIDKYLAQKSGAIKSEPIADTTIVDTNKTADVAKVDSTKKESADTTQLAAADSGKKEASKPDTNDPYKGLSEDQVREKHLKEHPFTSLFATYYIPAQENANMTPFYYTTDQIPDVGEFNFRITKDSMDKFLAILNRADIKTFIPLDLKVAVDAKPDKRVLKANNIEVFDFYALKRDPELTGDVIVDASQSFDPTTNSPVVNMSMNDEGSEKWARITGANLKKRIAIVLDDRIYSAPVVQAKITGGRSQISGSTNTEEARLLEVILKAGALKAPVSIVEERVIGPSLGQDSIDTGFKASAIAMVFVILYMIFYYNKGGMVADIAMMINVALIIAILTSLKGTLTLPGIAGIALTMGMSVDANVLIFERIREELEKGRNLRSSIDEGFGKAMSAIIDGNVTTAITAFILMTLASGPIQGFATTLLIGLITNLFTAVIVSRAIIELMISKGATEFNFGQPKAISN